MEILTIQRRLVEVGRIRLGAKKTSTNGKQYPAKLEYFRLTSGDRARLDAAAVLYGGEVRQWDTGWELFTESDVLPVAVVPGQAISQAFELWGQKDLPGGKKTAVICLRRCDGETEMLSDASCLCSAADEQTCKPTTRLSVVLTDVPGIGVWRVEAHGWNAASELIGSVRLLESLVASGRPVRARLRLDRREQATESETRRFVVPVLDIDHTLSQVLDSIGAGPVASVGELPAAAASFRPVPVAELPAAPNSSTAAQIAAVNAPPPKPVRANAAQPLKATGLAPRPAAAAASSSPPTDVSGGPVCAACGGTLAGCAVKMDAGRRLHRDGCPTDGTPVSGGDESPAELSEPGEEFPSTDEPDSGPRVGPGAEIGKLARQAFTDVYDNAPKGSKTRLLDRCRHALIYAQTGGRTASSDGLTITEISGVCARLRDITQGRMTYELVDGGIAFTIGDSETCVEWTSIEEAA